MEKEVIARDKISIQCHQGLFIEIKTDKPIKNYNDVTDKFFYQLDERK